MNSWSENTSEKIWCIDLWCQCSVKCFKNGLMSHIIQFLKCYNDRGDFFGLVLSVANNTHTFAITVYLLEICNDDTFSRGCSSSKIHLLQLYRNLEIALKCKVILRLFVSNSFCLSLSLWVSCLVIKLLGRILSVALMNQYVFA